jgi:ABC-type polysaccharide/polyol phosphate export permease
MSSFSSPLKFFSLVWVLGLKNLKLRYKNSFLGFLWSLLNPIMYLIIFSFVFGNLFNDIDRYPLYALTGLFFWSFFSTTTIQVIESLINSAGVLKSINVPTIAFPLGGLLSSLLSLFLTLVPYILMMFIFGMRAGWEFILFIPLVITFGMFTFGVSLILTSLNVYFRDIQIAWSTFMPAIFYATPIAYTFSVIPEKYKFIALMNPLYYYINGLRDILYYNRAISLIDFAIMLGIGSAFLWFGLIIFNRLKKGFISQY